MKIVSFGEILWDVFGADKKIGGAPFNFASHIARLGAESYMISAVGADENGREALNIAKSFGVDVSLVSVERNYPTGRCDVRLRDGKPTYDLVAGVAYDHIRPTVPPFKADALYMGTLAMRAPDSRRAFENILKYLDRREVFFDVNFRGRFYTRELVERLLAVTTVLKISDEEIGFFGSGDHAAVLLSLAKNHRNLKYVCLTRGAEGAFVFDCAGKKLYCSGKPESKPVSTVGAGDSFAAAFLYYYLAGEDIGSCLDKAVRLSDFVVTRLEAVPDYDPYELLA